MHATLTIRTANQNDDLTMFALYNEENDGATVLVAEEDDQIVAFVQHTGMNIYFIESLAKGAGTELVNHLKEEYGELEARNVSRECAGYWQKQGFEQDRATGERAGEFHYVWYADEEE